jgi:3-hydroxyanthranilate 3,4-dioxygenase
MSIPMPLNFKKWIDDNRHLLKPPVGNREVYEDGEFIIMVVGGPNNRKDYHYNTTPEFFYQLEGDIIVKTMQDGKRVDYDIKEGDIFLLPSKVPHSPQRKANTIGLVIEQKRPATDLDALEWYCENCDNQIYRQEFQLKNIVTELPVLMGNFYANEDNRTCNQCGTIMEPPKPLV